MGVDHWDSVLVVVHHTVVQIQVVVLDPDEEEPGGAGHLLVEKRP
jgi:hypothetical protein